MADDISDTIVAAGVVTNPGRRNGRPTIQGTRVAVEDILYALAAGESADRVAHDYRLTLEQVRQALAYSAELVHSTVPEVSDDELDGLANEGGVAIQGRVGD